MPWYIYALIDPREPDEVKRVRYIGASKNAANRLKTHIVNRKKYHSKISCWLRSMVDKNHVLPVQEILAHGIEDWSARVWQDQERKWIAHYRSIGSDLCNLTDGGESGYTYDPAVAKKISASLKSGDQSWRIQQAIALKNAYAEGRKVSKYPAWLHTSELIQAARQRFLNLDPEVRAKGIARSVAARKMPDSTYELILNLRCDGLSYSEITARLTEMGIPTKRGGAWNTSSVATVCQRAARRTP